MLSSIIVKAGLWLSLTISVAAQTISEDPTTDENLLQFKSRPDIFPPRLFVNTTQDGVAPGYIFMAPYQAYQTSAAIYEQNGDLIWYGWGVTGGSNVHDFKVCQYNGTDHLCFFQGFQYRGYARGQAIIMDTSLQTVKTVTALNSRGSLDQHEFHIVGDSALTTLYRPERYDLSAFNITNGEGWIQDSIFQDVNMTTGELNFEWSAMEHVALSEGYVSPNQSEVAGTGFNAASPWDYFHMNSVDKNGDGDYLISARHVSTLYKINGQTGDIIWRCGGKLSDFEIPNGLNWSYQHDARWLSQNASTDIISFFDNASNGFNQSADHSAGYIIKLNHDATPPTVELLHSYPAPEDQAISASQGNLQILNKDDWANSNTFVGWGSQPAITEHAPDGSILYRAGVAFNGQMNYRAYKFDLPLTPKENPALYTYALSTNDDTTYYMSWNGATEVATWRIYGRGACDSDWALLNEVPKDGFETNFTAQGYQEFGMVEAVAGNGTGLRNSTNRGIKPFVPSASLSQSCNGDGCQIVTQYGLSTGQEVVAETRPGCAALPITIANTAQDQTSNGGGSGENKAAVLGSGVMSMASISVLATLVIGLML
ncbi:hypothetical protein OHC33_005683 [Knufia fluminis]|uniref:ASST-domain-containing protein n=1 Tax=Knufia fluminis TaxID=191047 RepID=A0AAN8EPD8_9EURO|nr:hypothetical protein OHC33_005683 [Knufia fluminis]